MSFAMRLISRAAKSALEKAKESVDPDRIVQLGMSGLIEAARVRHETDPMPQLGELEVEIPVVVQHLALVGGPVAGKRLQQG